MIFKQFFIFIFIFCSLNLPSYSASNLASSELSLEFKEFLNIQTISNSVLTANITDKTGNLYAPLVSKFRIISNSYENKTLYLKAESITENGQELAMFNIGNQVYIAFTNVNKKPRSEALANCKMLTHPKYSPGVVAYPIISIIGAKNEYQTGKGKYELIIGNGVTDISVTIGSNILKNSFDSNDPMGFYQTTLSITESEI